MYKHVYYHKAIRSAELMLRKILDRAACIRREGKCIRSNEAFDKMACGDELSVEEYLSLDDFVLLGWVGEWSKSCTDKTLSDLSLRLVKRRMLKAIVIPAETTHSVYARNREQLRGIVSDSGYDPEYYMLEDEVSDIAYKGYMANLDRGAVADEEEIWFVGADGTPHRLSVEENSILTRAKSALQFREERWFVPAEVVEPAREQLQWT